MKHIQLLTLTASIALFTGCAHWYENFPAAQPVAFNQLPPAAQATVRNEIGTQPIAQITQESKYGETTYRVEVERKGINPTLWVAGDGSIIKESGSLVVESRRMNEAAGAQTRPMQQPKSAGGSNY
jgi:hypothetical protein